MEANQIPEKFLEKLSPDRFAMLGTNQKKPHCSALEGNVGSGTKCVIYENRPSPCRKFFPSFEHGSSNPQCDNARALYGLPPLTPNDFLRGKSPTANAELNS
jgi:Fe-S-cluster containining protein